MKSYSSAVTVDRPPAEVFRYLIEPAKQALWSDVPMRPVTPGELATGSRIEVTFGKGPIKATLGLEIVDVAPGSRLAFTTYSGPIKWQGEYLLKPAGEGSTALSQQGTLTFSGLWRLVEPMVGAEIKSAEIKELERLKVAAEQG